MPYGLPFHPFSAQPPTLELHKVLHHVPPTFPVNAHERRDPDSALGPRSIYDTWAESRDRHEGTPSFSQERFAREDIIHYPLIVPVRARRRSPIVRISELSEEENFSASTSESHL